MTRLIIQLGRLGDVINILPLAYHAHKNGERWGIMVCKEFVSVLEGCSYVDAIPFDGDISDLAGAHNLANSICGTVQCCQVLGDPESVRKYAFDPVGRQGARTESFQREAWDLLGRLDAWKLQPPLIFDQRDKDREAALLKGLKKSTKKTVVLAASGKTSPFIYQDLLKHLLSKYNVVDLSKIKAERIYDLLGIMEKAHCIVATDSAPLHLSYATDVPVCALVNDRPSLWHGSTWRPNHIFHCRYTDFPIRCVQMLEEIEKIGKSGWTAFKNDPARKVLHVWSMYEISNDTVDRHLEAKESWKRYYEDEKWIASPIEPNVFGRDSRCAPMKDEVRLPYLKDVMRNTCMRAKDNDIIVLTRCDTILGENLYMLGALCFARRTIVDKGLTYWHPAADLFAFTKKWWRENQHKVPDLLMGGDNHWSRVLMELIKAAGGTELEFAISRARGKVIQHEFIPPRLVHNEGLARKWLAERNIKSTFPPITEQCDAHIVNSKALKPYGYNPSIVRINGNLLMAYRWHHDKTPATRLALAELNDDLSVVANHDIKATGGASIEDPRFYTHMGRLGLAYVDSAWPKQFCSQVRHGWYDMAENKVEGVAPVYGRNDGLQSEKNWAFFERESRLYAIYDSHPLHIVLRVGEQISEFVSEGKWWPWGQIKGGAVIPFGAFLLRFFHSRLDNEPAPYYGRYYIGAMLMKPEPPFEVVRVSRKPIITGSEDSGNTAESGCAHWKANVVFPAGVIEHKDGWRLSIGVNDAQCAVVQLTEKDLKL